MGSQGVSVGWSNLSPKAKAQARKKLAIEPEPVTKGLTVGRGLAPPKPPPPAAIDPRLRDDDALELSLWRQIRMACLPLPIRQLMFAKPRRFRADFAWPDRMLMVEVNGGEWVNGGHNRGGSYTADCRRLCEAVSLGWRVMLVTGEMVEDGTALRFIEEVLKGEQK